MNKASVSVRVCVCTRLSWIDVKFCSARKLVISLYLPFCTHFRNVRYLFLRNDAPKNFTNRSEKRPLPRFWEIRLSSWSVSDIQRYPFICLHALFPSRQAPRDHFCLRMRRKTFGMNTQIDFAFSPFVFFRQTLFRCCADPTNYSSGWRVFRDISICNRASIRELSKYPCISGIAYIVKIVCKFPENEFWSKMHVNKIQIMCILVTHSVSLTLPPRSCGTKCSLSVGIMQYGTDWAAEYGSITYTATRSNTTASSCKRILFSWYWTAIWTVAGKLKNNIDIELCYKTMLGLEVTRNRTKQKSHSIVTFSFIHTFWFRSCVLFYSSSEQITEALTFLHYSGHIIHRNVCPSSILVTKKGTWKLAGLEFTGEFVEIYFPFMFASKIETVRDWNPSYAKSSQHFRLRYKFHWSRGAAIGVLVFLSPFFSFFYKNIC